MREGFYAVVVTYSFCEETRVYLFENYYDAKNYLANDWRREMYIDKDENGWDCTCEMSPTGDYAKIAVHFSDGDDITEWRIGDVYDETEKQND